MTINAATPTIYFTPGDGVTTVFGFGHPFFLTSDVGVLLWDTVNEIAIVPVFNGGGTYDYTVTGVLDQATGEYLAGGNVNFNTAPPATYDVIRYLAVPESQTLALVDGGKFSAAGVNAALDRLTILIKQLQRSANFSITAPLSDNAPALVLPAAALRANGVLCFDANGNVEIPDFTVQDLINAIENAGGGGGGASPSRTVVGNAVVGVGDANGTILIDAGAAQRTVTFPVALAGVRVLICKKDGSGNAVLIQDDAHNPIDAIVTPANGGAVEGRWVFSDSTNVWSKQ